MHARSAGESNSRGSDDGDTDRRRRSDCNGQRCGCVWCGRVARCDVDDDDIYDDRAQHNESSHGSVCRICRDGNPCRWHSFNRPLDCPPNDWRAKLVNHLCAVRANRRYSHPSLNKNRASHCNVDWVGWWRWRGQWSAWPRVQAKDNVAKVALAKLWRGLWHLSHRGTEACRVGREREVFSVASRRGIARRATRPVVACFSSRRHCHHVLLVQVVRWRADCDRADGPDNPLGSAVECGCWNGGLSKYLRTVHT